MVFSTRRLELVALLVDFLGIEGVCDYTRIEN